MVNSKDPMIGKKIGYLTILRQADDYVSPKGCHYSRWVCKCDCGNEIIRRRDSIMHATNPSCGCKKLEGTRAASITHGDASRKNRNRLYTIWANMKKRCNNPNGWDYKLYGGRGIFVCDEWKRYEAFKEWALKNSYREDLTLDRIDVDGPYSPENCRWATFAKQSNNKRTNRYLTYDGKTMSMKDWSKELNVNYNTLRSRVYILGMSDEDALSKPFRSATT